MINEQAHVEVTACIDKLQTYTPNVKPLCQ